MRQESTPAYDTIETFMASTIQSGPANDRIYLMKLGPKDEAERRAVAEGLRNLASERGYGKIFAKVPASAGKAFKAQGFGTEARVPKFFGGDEEALFMGCYLDASRSTTSDQEQIDENLALARHKLTAGAVARPLAELGTDYTVRPCTPDDAPAMAEIYGEVFDSYPFPIHEPEYLVETMASHVLYFGVEHEGRLVALASAETEPGESYAEMTDFATLPAWRGHGLAVQLLAVMEAAAREHGITTAFTIARALSAGMNITFARMGYRFSGTLINNTQISGKIESMNVWHKSLG